MLQSENLVRFGQERVEECDDSAFELSVLLRLDRDGREAFPQDDLTDIGCDEERNTVAETIALLKELVEDDDLGRMSYLQVAGLVRSRRSRTDQTG